MAPVGAWTAAAGELAFTPWIMFLIIFLWTPPHFWSLALFFKDDYVKARLPMMPVVKGESSTLKQILVYSIMLAVTSLLLFISQASWLYLVFALFLGFLLIKKVLVAVKLRTEKVYRGLFGYSIIYLFVLFLVIIIDSLVLAWIV